uniref:Uncharacterized protein n=1 Tax=Chromera velia CCMP2878 TaxID=1169474 RepID=A0A0G4FTD2_9ALVE|eukprot:Cvel_18633.t1-p1 / transcript=Cvel_18633.t1 / gene=Cvel_18633 / organism=Chromera_velia_CCMP2878 / gene_product=hypothetical protein / transcript_product=hypothetical protein / location=Cvel_scaffold1556:25561-25977(-) / protein_length=139 / sequence_SO=supercontig / SO=protein_coding / is_pseudo=false
MVPDELAKTGDGGQSSFLAVKVSDAEGNFVRCCCEVSFTEYVSDTQCDRGGYYCYKRENTYNGKCYPTPLGGLGFCGSGSVERKLRNSSSCETQTEKTAGRKYWDSTTCQNMIGSYSLNGLKKSCHGPGGKKYNVYKTG